jgi:cell division protein FtsI (penicillin-binding protein 3)
MINRRALIITAFTLLVFTALVVKLFSIQVSDKDYYSLVAEKQQYKPQVAKAERGVIKDVNGEVLSFTRNNISCFVDTRMMNPQKVDSVSSLFSQVFNKPKKYYEEIIQNGIRNVCLEKKVPMDKALQLKKKVIEGLFYEEDFTRVYPYGSLASHVLGYVNKNMIGTEGLERVCNKKLTGTDGTYVFERDVLGRIVSIDEKVSRPPVSGNDVVLTINKNYQKILQEELVNGLEKFGGESAVGIIMNPNNGEILALANLPDYDPANYEIFPADSRRNRAIIDTYEPGSTFKSVVMSILLDQKLAGENESINTDNGKYVIKNVKVSDDHPHPSLTVREILEVSSNVGMSKLSTRIKDDVFYKYLRDFGFGNPTAVELPGEAEGLLRKPATYTQVSKAFLSFGYGIAVTPLQIISAYCALVNGGTLYKPYVIKSITDYKGNVLEDTKPTKIRTVIQKSTSDLLRNIMVGVVEKGTGIAAQLDDVSVGGKTGTAQQLINGNYQSSKHNSSFVGFFPADNPQLICMIVVNAPEVGKYGGLVAAPIFHDVAKRILETDLTIVPSRKKIQRDSRLMDELMADIKSNPENTSRSYLNVAPKTEKNIQKRFSSVNKTIMPNLVNQSTRDAIAMLNEMGLEYKIVGNGRVVSQSIEPGAHISRGSICTLKCEQTKKINSIRMY